MSIKQINSDVHFCQSLEYLRLSNYQAAIESIDLAIAKDNDKDFYMFQKIKILFVAQMFSQCSDYISDNLLMLYQRSPLHIFAQVLYYYQTSSHCSVSIIEDVLLINSIPSILAHEYSFFINNPDIDLAENILQAKESDEYITCLDYCDLLLRKDRCNLTALLTKAQCHCLLGENDLGISTYDQAITVHPDVSSTYAQLGTVMLEQKNYSTAIHYLEHALDLDPSSNLVTAELAEAYYLWKKYDSALITFKKVLSYNPCSHTALLRVANIYEQINKPRRAKKYYKKVLRVSAQ